MNIKEDENSTIKVKDRRRFHTDGTPVEAGAEEPSPSENTEEPKIVGEKETAKKSEELELEADFASFVLSLAAGVQAALGIAPHPITGAVQKDLKQAKYTIDLLGVLQEKTKGNLSSEEEKLIQALLYDLRMRFIEAKNQS